MTLKSKRNSLIELFRFFFAMWVVYYHGYFFLPKTKLFASGYLAVEFFFILTGMFLVKDIVKHSEQSFIKGGISLVWKKLKSLSFTLVISLIFALVYFFMHLDDPGSPWGFMWYIKWLIAVPLLFYAVYRIVKNPKMFYIIIAAITVVAYVLQATLFYGAGILRGLYGIGIGVLLSLIPKNTLKIKNFNLNIVFLALFVASTILFALFNYQLKNPDHLFILLLAPGLLYFASCINVNFAPLNYFGGLSFGLYAYQTICRVLEDVSWMKDKYGNIKMFLILVALVIADDLIKRLIKYYKNKKHLQN
jgi:hypothetical protein